MNDITFANKEYFWLFLIYIPILFWYIWRLKKSVASMKITSLSPFKNNKPPFRYILRHFLFTLKLVAIALIITSLARPQSSTKWEDQKIEGVDIMIALDVSGSMLAEDFTPNRIEAAKDIGIEFVSSRDNDRLGLVVFAGETYTQCPLTIDKARLMNLFSEVKSGIIEDGTAIGMGLANAVNRLKDSKSISKVIILLTDGVNNSGKISPLAATELATEYGIRVYTIGIGKNGTAPYPFQTPFGVQYQNVDVNIDEDVLQEIAKQTGGKYFRATNNSTLKEIYTQIDALEKTQLEVRSYTKLHEEFRLLMLIAFGLIVFEQILKMTILKNVF